MIFKDLARTVSFTKYLAYVVFIKRKIIFLNVCTIHLYIVFIKNLCNLAKYKFFKSVKMTQRCQNM